MLTAVKVRLKLKSTKEYQFFYQHAGASRFIYNYFLNLQKENFEAGGKYISYVDMANQLPTLKNDKDTSWLKKIESTSLQQSLKNLDQAYQNFFNSNSGKRKGRKVGFPKFKSKNRSRSSFTMTCTNNNVDYDDNYLKIPKLGWTKVWSGTKRFKLIGDSKIKRVTFSLDSDSHWYASILIDKKEEMKYAFTNKTCGIDVGIKDSVIVADATKHITQNLPLKLKGLDKKLQKYQRRMSRKVLNSKNRFKAKTKVGRIHFKIKKIRENFQHQFSNSVLKHFDVITMETLSIQNLMKNSRLAKAIQNQSWYNLKNNLKVKAERNKKIVLEVNSHFPSSKICSTCGNIKSTLTLIEREWTCSHCNSNHDRDVNAARNLNLISLWYKSTGTVITTKSEFVKSITPYLKKVA